MHIDLIWKQDVAKQDKWLQLILVIPILCVACYTLALVFHCGVNICKKCWKAFCGLWCTGANAVKALQVCACCTVACKLEGLNSKPHLVPFNRESPAGRKEENKSGDLKLQRLRSWEGTYRDKFSSKRKNFKALGKLHIETGKLFALERSIYFFVWYKINDNFFFVCVESLCFQLPLVLLKIQNMPGERYLGTFDLLGYLCCLKTRPGSICFLETYFQKAWGSLQSWSRATTELMAAFYLIVENLKTSKPPQMHTDVQISRVSTEVVQKMIQKWQC